MVDYILSIFKNEIAKNEMIWKDFQDIVGYKGRSENNYINCLTWKVKMFEF